MGRIIAIGGGEIGRPGYPVETTAIDIEIIRLSGKSKPRLLFIPTASLDSDTYCDTVKAHFGGRLGCQVDILYLLKANPTSAEIARKILSSDIIYVGGGNTLRMMNVWRKAGVDQILAKAYLNNIVMSGLSAGALCWFKYGSSDSRKFSNPDAGLIRVRCLNIIPALCCPHYHTELDRRPHLKELMRKIPGVAIALDNCSAIELVDDKYRILTSGPDAHAYKVYWTKGEFHEELIEQRKEFASLELLLKK